MKKRVRKIANFFAFNLLFFALYLNFIHNDKAAVNGPAVSGQPGSAAFSGTVLVENPEHYLQPGTVTGAAQQPVVQETGTGGPLKLSVN